MDNDVYIKSIKLLEEIDTHEMYFISNNDKLIDLFERLKTYNPAYTDDISELIGHIKKCQNAPY